MQDFDNALRQAGEEIKAAQEKTTAVSSAFAGAETAKADSLRAERIRVAGIDDNLQDLISRSDVIVAILDRQRATLNDRKGKVETRLQQPLAEREQTVAEPATRTGSW